ncbi:hypothetical protein MP638_006624 [Amoeboaphelidium occidentale]|nr:hypothetical protein MP638_006624 [Amoeboaphelidium occidentale]
MSEVFLEGILTPEEVPTAEGMDLVVPESPAAAPAPADGVTLAPAEAQPETAPQSEQPNDETTPQLNPKDFGFCKFELEERNERIFRIMQITPERFLNAPFEAKELALERFILKANTLTSGHQDMVTFKLRDDVVITCCQWKHRCFITGTDIVRLLVYRFEEFTGKSPLSMKKFEEGIFSDLRRLQAPQDCVLENTRSDFLVHLFDYDCVRSKKKQKVFFWPSFQRIYQNIFCDAVERELARIQMARAVGLSVDEFIKSGIVPTGTSAHDANRLNLEFDWAVMSERSLMGFDTSKDGFLHVDQIHIIRNDMNRFFHTFLRDPLKDRDIEQFIEGPEVKEAFNLHYVNGPPQPVPKKVVPTPAGSEDDSSAVGADSDFSPNVKSRKSPGGRGKRRSPLVSAANSPRASGRSSPYARRSAGNSRSNTPSRLSSFFDFDYREQDEEEEEDDNYSVSTLSSNDEETLDWMKDRRKRYLGEHLVKKGRINVDALLSAIDDEQDPNNYHYSYPFGIALPCSCQYSMDSTLHSCDAKVQRSTQTEWSSENKDMNTLTPAATPTLLINTQPTPFANFQNALGIHEAANILSGIITPETD